MLYDFFWQMSIVVKQSACDWANMFADEIKNSVSSVKNARIRTVLLQVNFRLKRKIAEKRF